MLAAKEKTIIQNPELVSNIFLLALCIDCVANWSL